MTNLSIKIARQFATKLFKPYIEINFLIFFFEIEGGKLRESWEVWSESGFKIKYIGVFVLSLFYDIKALLFYSGFG